MKIIEKKSNITSIQILGGDLSYIDSEFNIYFKDEILFKYTEDLQLLHSSNKYLFTNTVEGAKGILINIANRRIILINEFFIRNVYNNLIICISNTENKTKISRVEGIENNEGIIFPFKISIYIIDPEKDLLVNSDHDFFIKKSIIELYKLSTGEKIWSFDLKDLDTWGKESKPYMIGEFSGIHENTLICTLQNGNILLLDLITGELKHIFENAKIISGLRQKKGSVFWGAKYREFIEVDVDKQITLRQISLESEFNRMLTVTNGQPGWFAIAKSFFYDGLFYFNSDSIIGILDPIEIKIIDFMKLELTESSLIKDVQVNGYLIYCLETKGNLTILESEAAKEYKKKHQKKL